MSIELGRITNKEMKGDTMTTENTQPNNGPEVFRSGTVHMAEEIKSLRGIIEALHSERRTLLNDAAQHVRKNEERARESQLKMEGIFTGWWRLLKEEDMVSEDFHVGKGAAPSISELKTLINDALTAVEEASESVQSANSSASEAQGYASQADEEAGNAQSSAEEAESYISSAKDSLESAQVILDDQMASG
jgi:uncharacterized protein YoxC